MGFRFRSDYVKVKCTDGSNKHVLRRVEDIPRAFEIFASSWSVKVSLGLKQALDAIEASPSVELKKELINLHDRINQIDTLARSMFVSAYMHWRGDPCNNQAFFDQQIAKLHDNLVELTKITHNIQSIKSQEKTLPSYPIPAGYFTPQGRTLPPPPPMKHGGELAALFEASYRKAEKRLPPMKDKIQSSNLILNKIESSLKKKSKQLKKEIRQRKKRSASTKRSSLKSKKI